jgi:hypothetical protein
VIDQLWWLTPIIPATEEAETGGLWFKASPGKKLARPHLINKPVVVVLVCNPSYLGSIGGRLVILSPVVPVKVKPYLKNKLKPKVPGV